MLLEVLLNCLLLKEAFWGNNLLCFVVCICVLGGRDVVEKRGGGDDNDDDAVDRDPLIVTKGDLALIVGAIS